ncbi:hypothetical protein [Bryobacter aggregatus]|uniref:hypothetical protein n=1 Tax=Bryobacter aggregatus TaxID=360054 RepID=UPI0012BAB643|nr:hypothetical protein [Bryobacter aggregatus]
MTRRFAPILVQQELARILESRLFRESHQLRSLLSFVVEETLAGREEGLKEYALGLGVFHRPATYDPRSDSIVRVQASSLRKKLSLFYRDEGVRGELRIELPRGGYVPAFVSAVEPVEPSVSRRNFLPLLTAAGGFALGGGVASWLFARNQAEASMECAELWGAFLVPGRQTIVSYGVPLFFNAGDGIYFRDVLVNQPTEQSKGRIAAIARKSGLDLVPQEDVYLGVGEATGVQAVSQYLFEHQVKTTVANSHYLGMSELVGKNLVIISSTRFQTLFSEHKLPTKFEFDFEAAGSFKNLDPRPGEPLRYSGGGGGVDTSHALLTVWPGQDRETKILSLSGTHTWSTLGVTEYALDPLHQRELHQKLAEDRMASPYFQVLVRVEGKYNRVRSYQYVTHRRLEV